MKRMTMEEKSLRKQFRQEYGTAWTKSKNEYAVRCIEEGLRCIPDEEVEALIPVLRQYNESLDRSYLPALKKAYHVVKRKQAAYSGDVKGAFYYAVSSCLSTVLFRHKSYFSCDGLFGEMYFRMGQRASAWLRKQDIHLSPRLIDLSYLMQSKYRVLYENIWKKTHEEFNNKYGEMNEYVQRRLNEAKKEVAA